MNTATLTSTTFGAAETRIDVLYDRVVIYVRGTGDPFNRPSLSDDITALAADLADWRAEQRKDWRSIRNRAALRRREAPPAPTVRMMAAPAIARLRAGREPRRGPHRSRAMLGRQHPMNRETDGGDA